MTEILPGAVLPAKPNSGPASVPPTGPAINHNNQHEGETQGRDNKGGEHAGYANTDEPGRFSFKETLRLFSRPTFLHEDRAGHQSAPLFFIPLACFV